jgi:HTH-type transcriptional regulator / antitoxin HigA
MRVKAIRTEADHKAALERIDALMDASAGTAAGDELDVLVDLVEHYEEKHVPMGFPTPVAAIEFRMEQAGLAPRDLVPYIGSRAKVSEVLSGKRALTIRMARALHEHLGIPADVLLRPADEPELGDSKSADWSKFPLSEMVKLGWLPKAARSAGRAGRYLKDLIRRAGCADVQPPALYRKNDRARINAKSDPWALQAWCWQVLATANEDRPRKAYSRGTVTPKFLREVVQLSVEDDGPVQAAQFLAKHGIPLVAVRHLRRTYLDGAALKLADGTPVVALTLRYDRIDNFWFCLLHELAHIGRHLEGGKDTGFVDDLNLQAVDVKESEADEWALDAAIPREIWESSSVRERPTPMAVVQFANKLRIHPAIVAGRVRFERKNFRMLSHFVGNGEIRRHFAC